MACALLLNGLITLRRTTPSCQMDNENAIRSETPRQFHASDVRIEADCLCKDDRGFSFDLCYRPAYNSSIKGLRFNCSHLPILRSLGFLESEERHRSEQAPSGISTPFVTACSSNHFGEVRRLVSNLQTNFPRQKIVFYDLGLKEEQMTKVKNWCGVEYRPFRFDGLPASVRRLGQYRWKPILIAVRNRSHNSIPSSSTSRIGEPTQSEQENFDFSLQI